eukprot:TRINITY_DN2248_c0_g1_i1.p1 TRINITY_DN2248_c0_g1~~TRINITY_DN2248_c0_g1_i1.p1  ORF type:complete len:690 (-),score=101.68 TRINITY_DN2248_c0_g1_i1:74-2143(-)
MQHTNTTATTSAPTTPTNFPAPPSNRRQQRWSVQADSWVEDIARSYSDKLPSRQYSSSTSVDIPSGDTASSPKIAPRTYSDKPVHYYNNDHHGSLGTYAHLRVGTPAINLGTPDDYGDNVALSRQQRRLSLPSQVVSRREFFGDDDPHNLTKRFRSQEEGEEEDDEEEDGEEDDEEEEALLNERREAARKRKEQDKRKSFLERHIHPAKKRFRFMMLFFFCITAFGHMFNYDSPSALVETLKEELDINDFWYNWFYSIYSWPNVIMAVLGGIIVDVVGRRFAVLLFCGIVFTGQVTWALGFTFRNYWIMFVGRFIFGIGSESLTLTMDYLVSYWFYGNEVILAMGILISNESLSDWANFMVSPVIAERFGAVYAPWAGTFISGVSLMGAFIVAYLDKKGQAIVDKDAEEEERLEKEEADAEAEENGKDESGESGESDTEEESESFRISDFRHLSFSYWVWVGALVAYYCCSFPFVAIAGDWIHEKWDYSEEESSRATSFYSLAAVFFAPTTGVLLDKYGGLGIMIIVGPLGTLGILVLWGTVGAVLTPYVLMGLMGVLYSCAAAMQGGVPRLVPERYLGTAYGVSYSLMNLFLAVCNLVVGIVQAQFSWNAVLYIFIGLAIFSTCCAVLVNSLNQCCWGRLNWSKEKMAYYETLGTLVVQAEHENDDDDQQDDDEETYSINTEQDLLVQ